MKKIHIGSVTGGTIIFGSVGIYAPTSVEKSSSGSGGATGDYSSSNTGTSNTGSDLT